MGDSRDSRLRIPVVPHDDLRTLEEQLAALADARQRAVPLDDLRARPRGELADAPRVADFAYGRGGELRREEGGRDGGREEGGSAARCARMYILLCVGYTVGSANELTVEMTHDVSVIPAHDGRSA